MLDGGSVPCGLWFFDKVRPEVWRGQEHWRFKQAGCDCSNCCKMFSLHSINRPESCKPKPKSRYSSWIAYIRCCSAHHFPSKIKRKQQKLWLYLVTERERSVCLARVHGRLAVGVRTVLYSRAICPCWRCGWPISAREMR